VSHLPSDYHVLLDLHGWMETSSLIGPAYQPITQVVRHDASTIPSLSLSITTCLGCRHFRLVDYPLSFPLSTIDDHSHAEGKHCHSLT
jgi:hypothetical protein